MDDERELREAAQRCRLLAASLSPFEALELVALAYEYEERAEGALGGSVLRLVNA